MSALKKKIILGLDPGLTSTGWGIISTESNKLSFIDAGRIRSTPKETMPIRLNHLFQKLSEMIGAYQPHEAALEQTFVNQNPTSALKLGHARGIVMLAPAQCRVPIFEYTANQVKKAVVGQGHAGKEQVMSMVYRLLPQANHITSHDACDALAIAICHAHTGHIKQVIMKGYHLS